MSARPEAVVLVGIPGAGKSTFYERRFSGTHVRIHLDALRTRTREAALLDRCLAEARSFVVDNTNTTRAERARYTVPARANGFELVSYYFEVSPQDAITRNAERKGRARVPVAAIRAAWRRLEPPAPSEGWDAMHVVHPAPKFRFSVEPFGTR